MNIIKKGEDIRMILRNLTIKIQGNRATTDSPVYLYQYDKNIHLIIDIKNCKYQLENNMYISYTIVKPNNEVVVLNNCFMKNNKAHIILEANLFDGEEEVGTALCQLKLYDNTRTSTIALPPFAIHVLDGYGEPIEEEEIDVLLTQDELRLLTENELALRLEDNDVQGSIKISELPVSVDATGFIPVVQEDTSYKYNLGSLATKHYTHDYVASAMSEMSTIVENVEQMAVSIEGKADISDLEEYATKQELENALSNLDVDVDLSEYATKDEVQTKVQSAFDFTTDTWNYATSVGEQALNDAKAYTDNAITNLDVDVDLSAYALKTEVPSIEGLATTQYVDEAISNIDTGGGSSDVDLSGYVTTTQLTTELNKKANTNHNHTNYAQATHHHSGSYISTIKDTTSLYYDGENNYIELYTSTTYYEPEIMETGANLYRVKLPTSGFSSTKQNEFHIIYNAYNLSASHNIYFTQSVFWEDGTLTSSISVKSHHIYEIILIRMNTTPAWIGKIIDYGTK